VRAFRGATVVFATVTFAFFLLLYTQALGPTDHGHPELPRPRSASGHVRPSC